MKHTASDTDSIGNSLFREPTAQGTLAQANPTTQKAESEGRIEEVRAVTGHLTATVEATGNKPQPPRFWSVSDVQQMLNYRSRTAFLSFVKQSAMPCIWLNTRRVLFPSAALNDWLAGRSSTGRFA